MAVEDCPYCRGTGKTAPTLWLPTKDGAIRTLTITRSGRESDVTDEEIDAMQKALNELVPKT